MIDYKPYTYLIGWSKLNLWYYGVEHSNGKKVANPSNLWTKYFTSSQIVCQMREYCGEPDIIQVRRVFSNSKAALSWEKRVLVTLNVTNDPKWINRWAHVPHMVWTDEARRKSGLSRRGKPSGYKGHKRSAESIAKTIATQKANRPEGWVSPIKGRVAPNKGVKMSDESRKKLSQSCLGRIPWNKGKKKTRI